MFTDKIFDIEDADLYLKAYFLVIDGPR